MGEISANGGPDRALEELVALVGANVPADAALLVASAGDEDLLRVAPGAREFPTGRSAHAYGASGLAAVAHLEACRARGARFLLVPVAERWRLDEDPTFERHLRQRYRLLADVAGSALFALTASGADNSTLWEELRLIFARCEDELQGDPVILDWNTGLDLRSEFPELRVFSPLADGHHLPYFDATVDVVALPASAPEAALAEARRAARLAVVRLPADPLRGSSEGGPEVEWRRSTDGAGDKVSIVFLDDGDTVDDQHLAVVESTLAGSDTELVFAADLTTVDELESEVLVLVSSRACPLPGWLQPLLRTFRERPDAAIVGGRVLTFHGDLLNAGGDLLADGLAHAAGLGGDPNSPLYSYVRPTDFVSPALLAIRRDALAEVGGLPALTPDLLLGCCAAVKRGGYRVYYQPESAAVLVDESAELPVTARFNGAKTPAATSES